MILTKTAEGKLASTDAIALSRLVEPPRRAIELVELEQRISRL